MQFKPIVWHAHAIQTTAHAIQTSCDPKSLSVERHLNCHWIMDNIKEGASLDI
jgi:hypothetical protein